MFDYLAICRRVMETQRQSSAHERNESDELSPVVEAAGDTSFVSFVSFVSLPPQVELVDEPTMQAWDGLSVEGMGDRLLAIYDAHAAKGDTIAAREAMELREYFQDCDRGEVRWPADADLDDWNRRGSSPHPT